MASALEVRAAVVEVKRLATSLGKKESHPSRSDWLIKSTNPPLFALAVVRLESAKGDLVHDPDKTVDNDVADNTSNDTIGNRVGERHDGKGQESRDGVTRVIPVDVANT